MDYLFVAALAIFAYWVLSNKSKRKIIKDTAKQIFKK